mmetsp:Transcript_865/g.2313  ORF Transcript_865/g.2313 Transcript_865/m.2313 type:complete len:384 (-) Transcript_865:31-1182(-)
MATPPTVPALTGNDSLNAFADCAVPGAASAGIHGEPSGGVVGLTSDSAMPASTAGCPAAARSRGMGNSSAADAAGSAAGGSGAEGAPTRSASSSMWMASRLVRMSDTRAALAYAPKKQKLVCDDTSKPSADSTRASMSHSCAGVDPGGSISQSDDARGERPEWNLAATHRHAAASIGSCMLRNAGPTARYRSRSAVPWKEASRPRRNLVTTLHIQSISTRRFDGAMLSDREDGGLARHEAASLASQDFNADSISKSAADGCVSRQAPVAFWPVVAVRAFLSQCWCSLQRLGASNTAPRFRRRRTIIALPASAMATARWAAASTAARPLDLWLPSCERHATAGQAGWWSGDVCPGARARLRGYCLEESCDRDRNRRRGAPCALR